jgi:hypothetical protein
MTEPIINGLILVAMISWFWCMVVWAEDDMRFRVRRRKNCLPNKSQNRPGM